MQSIKVKVHAKPPPPPLRALDTRAEPTPCGLVLHRVLGRDADGLVRAMHDLVGDPNGPPKFPGPNPVSLEKAMVSSIKPDRYWVCEKTDGIRFALLCTTYGGHRIAALVDRKLAVYLVPMKNVPRVLYQGSVLDGEVAYDNVAKRHTFLVFDAVMVSGIPLFHLNFSHRLAGARKALRDYACHDSDAVCLKMKAFYELMRLRHFVDAVLPAVRPHFDVDGLVLTPEDGEVVFGRHMGLFKFKPFGGAAAHTVDFLYAGGSLAVFDAGRHVPVGKLASTPPPPEGSVVECKYDPVTQSWHSVGVRCDKTTANDKFTFDKTMLNIRENLGIDDVAAHLARS